MCCVCRAGDSNSYKAADNYRGRPLILDRLRRLVKRLAVRCGAAKSFVNKALRGAPSDRAAKLRERNFSPVPDAQGGCAASRPVSRQICPPSQTATLFGYRQRLVRASAPKLQTSIGGGCHGAAGTWTPEFARGLHRVANYRESLRATPLELPWQMAKRRLAKTTSPPGDLCATSCLDCSVRTGPSPHRAGSLPPSRTLRDR